MKLLLSLFALLLSALGSPAGTSVEGEIKLPYEKEGSSVEGFKKEFGDVIKATTNWKAGDFFGSETVFAGVTLQNTSSKMMFYHYYVAFYDKDKKLVGTAGQGSLGDSGIKPGQTLQLGSCLVHLPKDRYKDIVSYQAVIYETDSPPKKK